MKPCKYTSRESRMIKGTAIILTNGWFDNIHAKTAHGLLRHSESYDILSLIDPRFAGNDAGALLNGKTSGVPIYATVAEAIEKLHRKPDYCIIGITSHGGILPKPLRKEIRNAIKNGISVVSGLHSYLGDDPEFKRFAEKTNAKIIDVRKPRPIQELRFWTGEIYSVKTPRIAMLGTDCNIGKRTTGLFILEMCRQNGIKTEMIYTGQTGLMQGLKYGFIFDATLNDFIGGEIERVIMECERESSPDLILIEGQASLRNPSGTCGSEFLLAGNAKGVILQHAPGRKYFEGFEELKCQLPPVDAEIDLIHSFGARTLAVTLNEEGMDDKHLNQYKHKLSKLFSIPVVRPLKEGVAGLLPTIQKYISEETQSQK